MFSCEQVLLEEGREGGPRRALNTLQRRTVGALDNVCCLICIWKPHPQEPSLRLLPARRRGEGAIHLSGASTLDFQPPEGRHRCLRIINHPDCGVLLQRPEETKPGLEGGGTGPAGEDTEEPGLDRQAGVSGTWGAPRSSAHTQGKVLNTSCLSK